MVLATFFGITPFVFLFGVLIYLLASFFTNSHPATQAYHSPSQTVTYAALPEVTDTYVSEVVSTDARVEIVRQFFEKYNSPLEPHAAFVVEIADHYSLDFRLIPAIAMQESNLCRRIPVNSYNCWGYGIYGDNVIRFKDYKEGIETVTRTLATKYRQSGLETPDEIMRRYTPSSNGSWANGVNHFLAQLQ